MTGNYTRTGRASLTEQFGSGTLHVNSKATLSGALNVTDDPSIPGHGRDNALTASSISGSCTSHTAGFTLTTNTNNIQVTKQ